MLFALKKHKQLPKGCAQPATAAPVAPLNNLKIYIMIYKNNPFNIRYSQGNIWLGEEAPRNGFCTFSALDYGIRAYFIVIRSYLAKHHIDTVESIINRFAPACENHTELYIEYVCKSFLEPSTNIDSLEKVVVLAQRMAYFESNFKVSSESLQGVITHFHIFDQIFK